MILIVGLGNPGAEYQKTRHNVGFTALDEFAKIHEFSPFTLSKKHSSLISEGVLDQVKVTLAKPQTFMNNSGKAVKSLLPKFSLDTTKPGLVVIHDDIDIPLGKVKVSRGSGSAGHKGVDSIIQTLGTKDFTRIRIGILPQAGKPEDVESFVLRRFSPSELPLLQSALQNAIQVLAKLSS